MTTINNVKKSGEDFIRSVCANRIILVFANIGLNISTNSGSDRQFIQHVGAFSPFQKNGQLYKAVAGPELAQQMKDNIDNVKYMSKMKKLGYSLENDVVLFSDAYQCCSPTQAIRAVFSYISSLKKSQKKICFILKDEDQVKIFSKFFIPSFIKLDAKVKNFICTSLDSILKSVRSNVDIETLPTLQSPEEKKEKLSLLLGVRSDLLCVSLYESFCILVHQQEVLRSVVRSLLAISNENQEQSQSEEVKQEDVVNSPNTPGNNTSFNDKESSLLAVSEPPKDDSLNGNELKLRPIAKSRPIKDFFTPTSTLTMFVHPVFYQNHKNVRKSTLPTTHLLYLQCHVHPTSDTFKVALKPSNNILRGDNINNEHFYEVKPNFTRYLCSDGSSLTCWTPKTTFDLLDSFITTTRKNHPAKQFNLFVKEFDSFKQLLLISEFKELLTRLDSIVTLFNNQTQSLARVPDLPLAEMTDYLNTILSQNSSCVLHTEQVSNVVCSL